MFTHLYNCLILHKFNTSLYVEDLSHEDGTQKMYKCITCPKVFQSQGDLIIHSLSHSRKSSITFQRRHLFSLETVDEAVNYLKDLPKT